MTQYENLLVETQGAVTRIIINREKKLNALSIAVVRDLDRALDALDPSTRVLIITGAGNKAFVAGADIAAMSEFTPESAVEFARYGSQVLARLESLDAVVIAEVNGYALGGGCELLLACDFAIASDNARLGQPEVSLGVTPGFGGTVRLSRRVGDAMARQLLVTGEQVKAERAREIGLVNEVVPSAELRARVDAIAAQILKNAPRAVALTKRSMRLAEETDLSTASTFEQHVFGLCFSTDDQKEGMRAFIEKRTPAWTGR